MRRYKQKIHTCHYNNAYTITTDRWGVYEYREKRLASNLHAWCENIGKAAFYHGRVEIVDPMKAVLSAGD